MKLQKTFGFLALSALLASCASTSSDRDPSAAVDPHYLSSDGVKSVRLATDSCGETDGSGRAFLYESGGVWYLQISNARCANLLLSGDREYPMDGSGNQNRSGRVWFPGPGSYRVILGSNKFVSSDGRNGTGDIFNVTIRPSYSYPSYPSYPSTGRTTYTTLELRNRQGESKTYELSNCGQRGYDRGTVRAEIDNGTVNVKFQNVDLDKCNHWDILTDNGDASGYGEKRLPNASPSYSIPKRYVQWGGNSVVVVIYGKDHYGNRINEERFNLRFLGAY